MRSIILVVCLLSAAAIPAGCVNVDADASDMDLLGGGGGSKSVPTPDPSSDRRSASDLQRENAKLRETLAARESERADWQRTIEDLKREIDRLEDKRDDLKDECEDYEDDYEDRYDD